MPIQPFAPPLSHVSIADRRASAFLARPIGRDGRQVVEWKNNHATKVPVGEMVIEKPNKLIV
jgi:hypothetical protein